MKHTRRKLVITMALCMAVAFVILGVAFNLIVNAHVRTKAQNCISVYMDNDGVLDRTEMIESQMAGASFIYDPKKDEPKDAGADDHKDSYYDDYYGGYYGYDDDYYDDGERHWYDDLFDLWNEIWDDDYRGYDEIFWDYYSENIVNWWRTDDTRPEEMYKVEMDDTTLFVSWKETGDGRVQFYYVNATSETEMIKTISIVMYIIMAVCIVGATLIGFFVGKKIETDQAKQKQFFENASHELKTPLMSIQGYAEGLQEGVISDTKEATAVILNETDKMTNLVNDILSLSRLESGAYKLNKESVEMYSFLSECLTSMEAAINGKDLKVDLKVEGGLPSIEADRVQLEKAVRNILSNAIRYAEKEIKISYDGKTLKIWDDGTPISEDSLKHLFERFYTGKNGNTGIGMSLTKEIVEQHGWKIKAENVDGGAQFVISM
ncbi:MAG: HAMP domain-containing histidine kinase [Lachnospiraceae bacterium]|nr:HAMP domain-containing histidine kinase [Lachnospiraceae bacterium]